MPYVSFVFCKIKMTESVKIGVLQPTSLFIDTTNGRRQSKKTNIVGLLTEQRNDVDMKELKAGAQTNEHKLSFLHCRM